ncbi:MAG: prephenate dehydrogenase/arogenate dehydrogenase family protein [Polyangia bacterium]
MTPAVSIVGMGRFGNTLGALLDRARISWEPVEATPHTEHYEALAQLVVVAVPLEGLAQVVRALQPRADQIIVDVCSVKVRAVEALREAMGEGRWVATHPLFGPSILRSDVVPRVVVCPRPDRPADTSLVEALYAQLGCTVSLMDAATHDRVMAESQALSAFVGGALRDAQLPSSHVAAPPSALPLLQLVNAQNAVAGHLRDTVLLSNPFAADVRDRLVDAMRKIIPAAPADADLPTLRGAIDRVDHQLVALLRERADLATVISQRKAELGRPVQDPEREAAAFAERRAWAMEAGIDPDFVEAVFASVLPWSRALQERARGG